ncbi:MAG: amino acid permease [Furfurilactobacillus sp.]|jgi:AAT family amino acid transporter|uniref:Amino acid permease n=1 Tax=Furfurilactobacillus milii TaxID=2888272 RepID=A0ABT6DFJ6_9LACO|nr:MULTISPECIES: amino acid permease [Furfurilactobacillus]QLE66991.1 D-serine-D-alanine-glycine transporter [Furfurilactobacillus rossiae]MCF6161250.1 amino acid permease [Furfurilactobacillus milii]MCF6163630.1 amino acid permease [Furfurilactobacillus milii]MCF6418999.1 amino acid permease [Furfurilactobacillus milii]MCH4011189.1 amino acid permease [Furfurilactobacillus sp.]
MAQQQLARNLRNRQIQLIAIGGTIGTGLFLGSGRAIHLAGPSILLSYMLTGVVTFIIMRALGEVLLSDERFNSFVDFIRQYLGETAGFIAGWTYWLCWLVTAMVELTAVGLYFRFWWPSLPQWLPGLVLLLVLLGLNLITVRLFGETEFWFALIKVAAIILLIIIGTVMIVMHVRTANGVVGLQNLVSHGGLMPNGWRGFVTALPMVVFSFAGIELIGLTAAETKDPRKILPKAINELPVRIILFYVGALFIIMTIIPWTVANANQSPFVQVFAAARIPAAASIINFVVITAAASACNSALFSTGRMLYTLTNRYHGRGIAKLGRLSKTQVPGNALTFSAGIIVIALILNGIIPNQIFTILATMSTTCFLFVWVMIVVAHLRYRQKVGVGDGTFLTPLTPVSDYFVLGFLAFVVIVMLFNALTIVSVFVVGGWLVLLFIIKRTKTDIIRRTK